MNLTPKIGGYSQSISIYILFCLFLIIISYNNLLDKYYSLLSAVFSLFIIGNLITIFVSKKDILHKFFHWQSFYNELTTTKLKMIEGIIIINRVIIFPVILVFYIFLLIITQFNIYGIGDFMSENTVLMNFIITSLIISGLCTLFLNGIERLYYYEKTSKVFTVTLYFTTIILALISAGLIYSYVYMLGTLGILISIFSALIFSTIGFLIIENS